MTNTAALQPMVAMAFLTFAVWATLFVRRVPGAGTAPVSLDLFKVRATRPPLSAGELAANDNLMNLFELPVLFYALCLALAVTGFAGPFLTIGCWAYVGLRAVHSAIHCSFNNVMMRFGAYLLSTLLLFALWIALAVRLAA